MKKIYYLILGSIAVFAVSCKKDSSSSQSNTDKLCGKNWKVVAYTINPGIQLAPGGPLITDYYSTFQSCEKDNFSTYNKNGTYVDDEGATKCDPADPQTTPGTWYFSNNETVLVQDSIDTFNVLQNDGNTLKVSKQQVNLGVTYTLTITANKQ